MGKADECKQSGDGSGFFRVTEQPWQGATRMQMSMLRTRYGWAAEQAAGKDVLEVASGAGLGLGWLAEGARRVEAGDIEEQNCRIARSRLIAGKRRFASSGWTRRICRLKRAPSIWRCCSRRCITWQTFRGFLEKRGACCGPAAALLISTVNCEWNGFHPSPFHTRYWTAPELLQALDQAGFEARLFAGFPERDAGAGDLRNRMRSVATRSGCIPRTMRGKAVLKRIFYGRLERIPSRLEPGEATLEPMIPVDSTTDLTHYRNLYFEGRRAAR